MVELNRLEGGNIMEWISVDTRLPEQNQLVLMYGCVAGDYGYTDDKWCMMRGQYKSSRFNVVEATPRYFSSIYVTRWMPLPPAPDISK